MSKCKKSAKRLQSFLLEEAKYYMETQTRTDTEHGKKKKKKVF